MRRAESHAEVLSEHVSFPGKVVVDVGCGIGDLTRWLVSQGCEAVGVDTPRAIAKAEAASGPNRARYVAGLAESLPLEEASADVLLYIGSFHHVPKEARHVALKECSRVMKASGRAVFIEPVAQAGSYYEIVRLHEDEAQVQTEAYEALHMAHRAGLAMAKEDTYYLERSFEDFNHLLDVYLEDESKREGIMGAAREITERMARESATRFEAFRYRSVCRLNVLERRGS
ncbi:MAG: class I SAM-dependent methyltransferase [Acidobacteriota bacterium]